MTGKCRCHATHAVQRDSYRIDFRLDLHLRSTFCSPSPPPHHLLVPICIMAAVLRSQLRNMAAKWPTDPFRPNIQLKTLLTSLAEHPNLTGSAVRATQAIERDEFMHKVRVSTTTSSCSRRAKERDMENEVATSIGAVNVAHLKSPAPAEVLPENVRTLALSIAFRDVFPHAMSRDSGPFLCAPHVLAVIYPFDRPSTPWRFPF